MSTASAVPMLQVQQLSTGLGAEGPEILSAVDITLNSGEVLGVVGESGSGKSLLALSIMGLLPPAISVRGGQVFLQSQNLLQLQAPALRALRGKAMAMIFQEPMTSLNPVHTVGAQIAEAVRIHQGLSGPAAMARAAEMLGLVRIPDAQRRVNDYPHQFSGGMRQRVMIAMALSCEPELLIADEPTTALDVTTQSTILDLMRDLQAERGMAIMFITHDLGVVAEIADDVAVMYLGKVVEQADVDTLFHDPRHPYTRALMASVPKLGQRRPGGRLASIRGMVPHPFARPQGCGFNTRCDLAIAGVCASRAPQFLPVAAGHAVSCHLEDPEFRP